jgi:hypothetical protein
MDPNYRAFARDMMKLCAKHKIRMTAYAEGTVLLGPAKARIPRDFPYSGFSFSPTEARIGDLGEEEPILITKLEEDV